MNRRNAEPASRLSRLAKQLGAAIESSMDVVVGWPQKCRQFVLSRESTEIAPVCPRRTFVGAALVYRVFMELFGYPSRH